MRTGLATPRFVQIGSSMVPFPDHIVNPYPALPNHPPAAGQPKDRVAVGASTVVTVLAGLCSIKIEIAHAIFPDCLYLHPFALDGQLVESAYCCDADQVTIALDELARRRKEPRDDFDEVRRGLQVELAKLFCLFRGDPADYFPTVAEVHNRFDEQQFKLLSWKESRISGGPLDGVVEPFMNAATLVRDDLLRCAYERHFGSAPSEPQKPERRFVAVERERITIIVTERARDFYAQIENEESAWGTGRTPTEAVGCLFTFHRHQFGVWTASHRSTVKKDGMTTILLTSRGHDWHASIEDEPEKWSCACACDDAVGNLVLFHPERFGVIIRCVPKVQEEPAEGVAIP